jgi:hypothetical protein
MTTTARTKTKYAKGVQTLRPELLEKIRAALAANPSLSKSALARVVGVSRQTIVMYLKALPEQSKAAAQRSEENRDRVLSTTHHDLVDSIGAACVEVNSEIQKLRAMPSSLATSTAIFKGFGTLERLWRLLGEVLGQVSPPVVNVYMTKVDALLSASVTREELSPELRAALDGSHGPT